MGTWDWKSLEIHICRQGNACPCLLDMFLIHLLEFFSLTLVPLGYSCGEVEHWPCGFFGASVARAAGTCSVYGWAVAAGSSCHCSVTAASEKEMTFSGTELWPLSFHKDFLRSPLGSGGKGWRIWGVLWHSFAFSDCVKGAGLCPLCSVDRHTMLTLDSLYSNRSLSILSWYALSCWVVFKLAKIRSYFCSHDWCVSSCKSRGSPRKWEVSCCCKEAVGVFAVL